MAGVTVKLEPELVSPLEASLPAVEKNHADADGSTVHLSDNNRSTAATGLNAVIPNTSQFTIFYNGMAHIYDGIPAEKLHEIMLVAAAAAKSVETKKIGMQSPLLSPVPTRPSSPHGITNNIASTQELPFPAKTSSICRLQEFPIARRNSLQSFLEKRRNRLGSKAPYPSSSTTKVAVADNIEHNFSAENAPDLVSAK